MGFELQDVTQFMDFRVLNLHLEVRESFPLRSRDHKLEINIFHISYTIIFYPFLIHFYISCIDRRGIRETRTELARILNSIT